MTKLTKFPPLTVVAALLAVSASAQSVTTSPGSDYDSFASGLAESGQFDALDRDGDASLSAPEYAAGLYADHDRDDDGLLSESEVATGVNRYLGPDKDVQFGAYDADVDGVLDKEEFGDFYDAEYTDYYDSLDINDNALLSEVEYSTGLYDSADTDGDGIVDIEDQDWFEDWNAADTISEKIEEIGDIN